MSMIYVRTAEGRVAFSDEAGKLRIPHDRWIPVQETSWIRRLIALEDIEQQPEQDTAPSSAALSPGSASPPKASAPKVANVKTAS